MVFCQVNHVFPQFRDSMASNCDNNEDSDEYFEPEDEYFEPEDDYLSPEDSYMEPEDDYIEDDDEIISEWETITIRGMIFSTLVNGTNLFEIMPTYCERFHCFLCRTWNHRT